MLLVLAVLAAVFVLPTGWGIAAVVAATVVELGEVWFWIWYTKRRQAAIGAEALPGARGVVVSSCRPDGRVRVAGEVWRARCEEGADEGDEIVVERLGHDLTLIVNRAPRDGN